MKWAISESLKPNVLMPDNSIKRSVCLLPFKNTIDSIGLFLIRFFWGSGSGFFWVKVQAILENWNMELLHPRPNAGADGFYLHENTLNYPIL